MQGLAGALSAAGRGWRRGRGRGEARAGARRGQGRGKRSAGAKLTESTKSVNFVNLGLWREGAWQGQGRARQGSARQGKARAVRGHRLAWALTQRRWARGRAGAG